MRISDLPPELHVQIIALVCAEIPSRSDVPIGFSLALVSSYWYSITKPFRYYSLRVASESRISKLLLHLVGLPEHERRVRYLSLSDASDPEKDLDEDSLTRQKLDIGQLLTLLTPSLFILELELENPVYVTSLFALLWELSSPHLALLSIKGYYCFPTSSLNSPGSNTPHLEHLSLDGLASPSGFLLYGTLGSLFPRLVTLGVHGLRRARYFAHEVCIVVREWDERLKAHSHSELCRSPSRLPETLRLLPLFPSTVPLRNGHRLHIQMINIFTQLVQRAEARDASALLVVVGT